MTEPDQKNDGGAMQDLKDDIFGEIDGGQNQEEDEEKDEVGQGDE
jgi:hypothetical protein